MRLIKNLDISFAIGYNFCMNKGKMKKQKVYFFDLARWALIALIVLTTAGYVYILWYFDVNDVLLGSILATVAYVAFTIVYLKALVASSGNMIITDETIRTKLKGNHRRVTVRIADIKDIIIINQPLLTKDNSNELALRVASKNGIILGYGRKALNTLLRRCPNAVFRVSYVGWQLGKKNAVLLGQRGCLGIHKREQLAKLYRVPVETFMPQNDAEVTDI